MTIVSSPHSTPIAAQFTVPSGLIVVVTVSTIIPERPLEDVERDAAGVEGPPALRAHEPDLGGAEQERVDLVEVPVGVLEDLAERLAEVRRGRRRQALDDPLEVVVGPVDGELDLAPVEDRVVRAPDPGAVVSATGGSGQVP